MLGFELDNRPRARRSMTVIEPSQPAFESNSRAFSVVLVTLPMERTRQGILGIQLTVVGLFLVTYFDGVASLPLVGLALGVAGTVVTIMAVTSPP